MMQKFILAFFLLIFFSCKKDGTSNQQNSKDYYFEATLTDGKTFKVNDDKPTTPTSAIALTALLTAGPIGEITTGSATNRNNCALGRDCFLWTFQVLTQNEGTFTPTIIAIISKESPGAEQFQYISTAGSASSPGKGNVSVTISKVEKGTQPGSVEGTFSGTVMRAVSTAPDIETPVQVSGKFRLAIE
jgi:hypothetical protein